MLIEAMVSAPTMTRLPDGQMEWRLHAPCDLQDAVHQDTSLTRHTLDAPRPHAHIQGQP